MPLRVPPPDKRSISQVLPRAPLRERDVSTRLAEQFPEALLELLRGFQAAGEATCADPQQVYDGLLTVLLRLVFLLHAEDHGLLPGSVTRLYLRLCEDAGGSPDTIHPRFEAWPSLLSLFRRVFTDGAHSRPARHGRLFEGHTDNQTGQACEPDAVPRISDGILWRVLQHLRELDGEPLSYRALDIEQIGGIYEAMMGLGLERARGPSIAVRPRHVVVDLAALLSQKPDTRGPSLEDRTGCELSSAALAALAAARTPEDILAALGRRRSHRTPEILPAGSLYLQPGDERRNSGSHYTPRSLTEPIVRTALRPVIEALGEYPTPEQLLSLKICDPAMGSGAFLVEACRQLGDHLERAWAHHHAAPTLSPGDELHVHARRLVAQRCLHGVDKDPFAVDLAKMSLWLLTRPREPPSTFLDHALKRGDSLVGLTRAQIAELRQDHRTRALPRLDKLLDKLRCGDPPVSPFHWELEFPDVFDRERPGFDCIVGNPPFLGGTHISATHSTLYFDLLVAAFPGSGNRMDLAAYFFRRAFQLLRSEATLGLIGTNTIAQGDSRIGGLSWICRHGGTIYAAERRRRWPGLAAVVVSVVHVARDLCPRDIVLDGRRVERISAFLFHAGGDAEPRPLAANKKIAFEGFKPAGQGFIFDDADPAANPTADMNRLLAADPRNQRLIQPYIGGSELNHSPTHAPARSIINFNSMSEEEASAWPALLDIVRRKVKPQRDRAKRDNHRKYWWRYGETRPGLCAATATLDRVLVASRHQHHWTLAFLPPRIVFSEALVVFALSSYAAFSVLQSRVHELWARFFGSSLEDRLRYTLSDCFEAFPFPPDWRHHPALERAGEQYYQYRAALMIRNDEGLTATYNRFHDPDARGSDILGLRELHAAVDRAVLAAYGWTDLAGRAGSEFRLDYEDNDARARKKPWRHRWPQDLHDEVLARLLDLNQRRSEEERRSR